MKINFYPANTYPYNFKSNSINKNYKNINFRGSLKPTERTLVLIMGKISDKKLIELGSTFTQQRLTNSPYLLCIEKACERIFESTIKHNPDLTVFYGSKDSYFRDKGMYLIEDIIKNLPDKIKISDGKGEFIINEHNINKVADILNQAECWKHISIDTAYAFSKEEFNLQRPVGKLIAKIQEQIGNNKIEKIGELSLLNEKKNIFNKLYIGYDYYYSLKLREMNYYNYTDEGVKYLATKVSELPKAKRLPVSSYGYTIPDEISDKLVQVFKKSKNLKQIDLKLINF